MNEFSVPPIEVEQLTKRFGRVKALDEIAFSVSEGSACALLGANGAGKSTLFRILIGALRPTSGAGRVFGTSSRGLSERAYQRLGYVAEGVPLPEWMTGEMFLRYCRGMYPQWDRGFEARLLRLLDLDLRPRISSLSRGMRMKLAVVSSLAYRPALLLLDEPFAGLDVVVRDELIQALVELMQQESWTMLLSTHEVHEIEQLADRVIMIESGTIKFDEPVDRLYARFRRIRLHLSSDALHRTDLPPGCLHGRQSGHLIEFVETAFSEQESFASYRIRFQDVEQCEAAPLTLREIVIALRKQSVQAGAMEGATPCA